MASYPPHFHPDWFHSFKVEKNYYIPHFFSYHSTHHLPLLLVGLIAPVQVHAILFVLVSSDKRLIKRQQYEKFHLVNIESTKID